MTILWLFLPSSSQYVSAVWGCSHTADGLSFRLIFALCASLNRNGEQLSCTLSKLLFNGWQPLLRQIEGRMTGELEVHHSPQLRFLLCTHYLFAHILIGNRVQIGGINSYRYYPECLRSFFWSSFSTQNTELPKQRGKSLRIYLHKTEFQRSNGASSWQNKR